MYVILLNTLKLGKLDLFILIALVVTFSFSKCTEELSLKIRMTSHPYNKYEQITFSDLLSVN